MNTDLWEAKLWAWTHDPPEKALVLMRRAGRHDEGTVIEAREEVLPHPSPEQTARWDHLAESADHYAAAGDRPQFPYRKGEHRYAPWAQPRFVDDPEIVHPLSGARVPLNQIADSDCREIEKASFGALKELLQRDGGVVNLRRTLLAWWRFMPERAPQGLGALWGLLPADSRVPDHSLFAHLDLTSALAGAMAADAAQTPALLAVSLGPVHDFILTARAVADSWAGSHLLSCMAWEAMKVIAAEYGPDALLYPSLRGLPLVDAWLRDECRLGGDLFEGLPWTRRESDANPLYIAALPNKFMAIVPASAAEGLAQRITAVVQAWIAQQAEAAFQKLLAKTPEAGDGSFAREQIAEQLRGFPEVHWAVVPWSLATAGKPPDAGGLQQALAAFCPGGKVPFFETLWPLLSKDMEIDGQKFFTANRGALFSEYARLADLSLAAAKSLRSFEQLEQNGYRCALCGEREPLATRKADFETSRAGNALWDGQPVGVHKERERLCALCATKRMWRWVFADQVSRITGGESRAYIVSTHAMALAPVMARPGEQEKAALRELIGDSCERVALPPRLQGLAKDDPARLIPGWLEAAEGEEREERLRKLGSIMGARPEGYYALALLDGDQMGKWVGGDAEFTLSFAESWHSQVCDKVRERAGSNVQLQQYMAARRPASPARQLALSEALNNFAQHAAPFAIEKCYHGKLIYAGGDDVLAMLPVHEAPAALLLLRLLFSGIGTAVAPELPEGLRPRTENGFIQVSGTPRLLRMMGHRASLSGGLVIAQHTAPLGLVMRSLHAAEHRAKLTRPPAGALAISLLKRSGGETRLTLPWWRGEAVPARRREIGPALLNDVAGALREDASRRFVYHLQQRLALLPNRTMLGEKVFAEMLQTTCALQAERQGIKLELAQDVVAFCMQNAPPPKKASEHDPALCYLTDFLTTAEFLGRAERHAVRAAAAGGAA